MDVGDDEQVDPDVVLTQLRRKTRIAGPDAPWCARSGVALTLYFLDDESEPGPG